MQYFQRRRSIPHIELVTAPASEPLTAAEAKLHLRSVSSTEDALVTRWIAAARRQVEAITHRRLITQHWRIYRDCFEDRMVLDDVAPVTAIDSVKCIDTTGALVTLSASVYQLVKSEPARLELAYDQSWPDIRGDVDGVRIEVTSGYGGASAIPEDIVAAMLLIIGHFNEHREENADFPLHEIPLGARAILSNYVVPVV